ncbi:MAG: shikimate dehydrogenase [Capsulimonadaceae bacterium]|nr:shikimate dehydrogenase [Capsulimonadaceae bacterium]
MVISGKTRVVGVWGYPVGHSRSPAMHNAAIAALGLDWVYVPFAVAPVAVAEAVAGIRALGMLGVNVTVPLKQAVIPYLDEIDPVAERLGSVNTIVNRDGILTGYSTDGPGFLWDLADNGVSFEGKRVLIWGAGGASRAVAAALAERDCRVTVANRTLARARDVASLAGQGASAVEWGGEAYDEAVAGAELLVNTTSLGMTPASVNEMPFVKPGALHAGQVVYDLVYAPERTRLLVEASAAGCRAIGGLGMLVRQGAVSLAYWANLDLADVPVECMAAALTAAAS